MMKTILIVVFYVVIVNVAAYCVFAYDKRMARGGGWRISERTLLGLAFVGGSVGSVAAQQIVRHKTRKEPFCTLLHLILVLQIGFLLGATVAGPERLNATYSLVIDKISKLQERERFGRPPHDRDWQDFDSY